MTPIVSIGAGVPRAQAVKYSEVSFLDPPMCIFSSLIGKQNERCSLQ